MPYSKNNEYRDYFVRRFGIPADIMDNYEFYESTSGVWAFSGAKDIDLSKLDAEVVGIRALRVSKALKPTTAFLRVVGHYATKNVVQLNSEQALEALNGIDIEGVCGSLHGYVIIRTEHDVLGCGVCREGTLISQIPKKYRPDKTWL